MNARAADTALGRANARGFEAIVHAAPTVELTNAFRVMSLSGTLRDVRADEGNLTRTVAVRSIRIVPADALYKTGFNTTRPACTSRTMPAYERLTVAFC